MAVYVDQLTDNGWKMYGRPTKNCHLIADSIEEVKEFAVKRLGMKESWFQGKASTPHFDLTESRRKAAVAFGAQELTLREFGTKIRELRARRNAGGLC